MSISILQWNNRRLFFYYCIYLYLSPLTWPDLFSQEVLSGDKSDLQWLKKIFSPHAPDAIWRTLRET